MGQRDNGSGGVDGDSVIVELCDCKIQIFQALLLRVLWSAPVKMVKQIPGGKT